MVNFLIKSIPGKKHTGWQQIEALSAIRAIYFAAGFLGASPVVAIIRSWWSVSYELHLLSSYLKSSNVASARSMWLRPQSLFIK